MQRRIYRAVLIEGKEKEAIERLKAAKQKLVALSERGDIECPSIFRYGKQIFMYFEFSKTEVSPEAIFTEATAYLEQWPGLEKNRKWVLMHDIFHYQAPQNHEEWRRKTKVEMPWGRVIRLKPEMISSYIFYHYQYQEEKPGDGDKFGIIGIHEDLLFFYCEYPTYLEKPTYKGSFDTTNTPLGWGELMGKHFLDWPDASSNDDNWRDAEVIVTLF